MTRQLKKTIWPYKHFFKTVTDEHGFEVDDEKQEAIEKWIWENLHENIRNRLYVVNSSKGTTFYFKEEKDYQWFIWRWI